MLLESCTQKLKGHLHMSLFHGTYFELILKVIFLLLTQRWYSLNKEERYK